MATVEPRHVRGETDSYHVRDECSGYDGTLGHNGVPGVAKGFRKLRICFQCLQLLNEEYYVSVSKSR